MTRICLTCPISIQCNLTPAPRVLLTVLRFASQEVGRAGSADGRNWRKARGFLYRNCKGKRCAKLPKSV